MIIQYPLFIDSSSDAQSTSLHGTSESIKSSPPHHSLNDSLKNLTLQDNSLSLSSEDYLSCCLLISGFDPSLQPEVKENLLKQFYNYGGKSQWFRSLDAEIVIFAFSSNQKASLAYQQSKLRPPLRVVFLNEYDERNSFKLEVDEGKTSIKILSYSLAAKELVGSFKPEIDSRVANRMISAALGIRRTSNTPKTQKTKPRKAPSPPRTDAWDD